MSPILDNFNQANEYFNNNHLKIKEKYLKQIGEFELIYNNIAPNPGPNLTAAQGTSIAIAFRALKFLYTAFDLVSHGHTQEARIILRNIQELRIVFLDIATDTEAYGLWHLAQSKNKENPKQAIIDSGKLKHKIIEDCGGEVLGKLTVESSVKRLRKKQNSYIIGILKELIGEQKMLSEFVSHENIFNLVRRMDIIKIGDGQEQIDVYMGNDASSELDMYFKEVLFLAKKLRGDVDFVLHLNNTAQNSF